MAAEAGHGFNTFFQERKMITITPIAALQHQAPITFFVPGSDNLWMDLYNSTFEFRVRLLKADGLTDIGAVAANDVSPINNLLHSMFSTVDIELGGKPIADQNALYPYRAYLDTILHNSFDSLGSKGECALFFKDDYGAKMIDFAAKDGTNKGLVERRAFFPVGKAVTLTGKLMTDLFQMNNVILPAVSLKIKLIPSKDAFVLVTPAPGKPEDQVQYQLKIEQARFHLKTMEATPVNAITTEKELQVRNRTYDMVRKTLKHYSIPMGQTASLIDNVYLGERPDRIIMVVVNDSSMTGGYQENPFNFLHANLNYINLTFDGVPVMSSPYTPNFPDGEYINEYQGLMQSLGLLNQNHRGFMINRVEYGRGYTIFGFDLTTDLNTLVRDPPRNGTIRLELKFAQATPKTINVILMAEYRASFEIDKYRNVITNFP